MSVVSQLIGNGESGVSRLRSAWERLHGLPGGKRLFSNLIGRAAPYTGSIGAVVEELGEGRARVRLPDRPAVRNHLRSVHAIALTNLAELTGSLALSYALPQDARFIPTGLDIRWKKKARGTIRGFGQAPVLDSNAQADYAVQVTMRDGQDDVVATAVLHVRVGPK